MDEKYRAPLAMFYLEDLSYKEMAEVLGLPIGTIMSRLSRGKGILRRRLQAASPPAVSCRTPRVGGARPRQRAESRRVTMTHYVGISRPANHPIY